MSLESWGSTFCGDFDFFNAILASLSKKYCFLGGGGGGDGAYFF